MPFSSPTQAWFDSAFAAPTPAQEQGWGAIERGEHTLILAPTGSGKTLAAFLWALDRLLTSPSSAEGCRVLYVSPLKALTYDVERNLRAPLAGIAREAVRLGVEVPTIRVATRTGDTSPEDRRAMAKRPPDILITTPESLYLLLTSKAASMLDGVEHVIIDEVHAVAGTKRGAHLALSMERLERRCASAARPHSPQRIGLSATQRPLEELARYLGGADWVGEAAVPRQVAIVDAGVRKTLEIEIVVPVEDMGELGRPLPAPDDDDLIMRGAAAGEPEVRSSIWPAVYPRLLELIYQHRSTLIFVNSRRLAERLAARLNELHYERLAAAAASSASDASPSDAGAADAPDARGPRWDAFAHGASAQMGAGAPSELVRAHHGSIAREQRLEIEDALKAGRLPALVATSSLELGIDMGAIDLVVQVESPTSVASGLQRIGRAGHQVGQPSKGRIFPKFRHDLLVAAVVVQRMHAGLVEETRVPQNPLDILAQQVVAIVAAAEEPVAVDEIASLVRGAYPFVDLPAATFEGVLDMLAGRYPSDEFAELRPRVVWDRIGGTLSPRPGARMLAVVSGGTIPDRGLFGVFTPEGGRVGELDEEMVYESRVGETFLLGATTWRIEEITRDRVIVTPAPGVPGKMPFWHGDTLGRPFELGAAVGAFTRRLASGELGDEQLAQESDLDPWAVRNLRSYVAEEMEATGGLVPTDRQIVVERFRDELGDWRMAVLTPFGARVHAPWAMAIEARLRQRGGAEAQAVWSDDGIIVRLPEAEEPPSVDEVLIGPGELDDLVVEAVGSSALFAARFRENAARALLLPRRRPGSRTPLWQLRQRAADLLGVASRYGQFPILLETYRECLRDVFDLPALSGLLTNIAARRVRVSSLELALPSPFASGLVFSYVAAFMYEGDAPLAERRAQALTLDRRMLAELLGSDELRDLLDASALESLELELQALQGRRRATSFEQASDLLRRLGDLTPEELAARCVDGSGDVAGELVQRRRAVLVRVAGEERLIAAEEAGRYRDALGVQPPPGLPEAYLEAVPDALVQLVRRWARVHGPFTPREPAARLGVAAGSLREVLDGLVLDGRLQQGAFRPGGIEDEWCDVEVLRLLRQRSLAVLRREVEPADAEALSRFLPGWHGVAAVGTLPVAGGLDRLWEVIGQLQGLALPASVWESDILASRVRNYQPRLLDELLASGEVMWVGAGSLGRNDGRVVFVRREDGSLLLPRLGFIGDLRAASRSELVPDAIHVQLRETLAERGACFFRELLGHPAGRDNEVLEALWDLVWAGEVTNDSLAALRATLGGVRSGGGRRRSASPSRAGAGLGRRGRPSLSGLGPARGQGRWSLVERELGLELAAPEAGRRDGPLAGLATEAGVAAATVLLERYGVLTREAVRGEGIPGGFAGIYPVLKTMEEAGRIRRGYFVAGMGGAQFAVPGAVDRLRSVRDGAPVASPGRADDEAPDDENLSGWAGWGAPTESIGPGGLAGAGRSGEGRSGAGRSGEGRSGAGRSGEGRSGAGRSGEGRSMNAWSGDGRSMSGWSGGGPGGGVDQPPRPAVTVMAATDPASTFGLSLPWPVKGPQRVPGAHVVAVAGQPSLYVERGGKGLVALRDMDGSWEADAIEALVALVRSGRWARLQVAKYPEGLEKVLRDAEFVPTPKGLVRYG